jgi:hypothetical protein
MMPTKFLKRGIKDHEVTNTGILPVDQLMIYRVSSRIRPSPHSIRDESNYPNYKILKVRQKVLSIVQLALPILKAKIPRFHKAIPGDFSF